jgi:hypothetical protein
VIGQDIFLPAQATGVILERLIAIQLSRRAAGWRPGNRKTENDIVCIKNPAFSFEIKTSSSKSGLYGNRSTGHISSSRTKVRTGYYLVLNYTLPTEESAFKAIQSIRFGWIDDEDWKGQDKPTGQQASQTSVGFLPNGLHFSLPFFLWFGYFTVLSRTSSRLNRY